MDRGGPILSILRHDNRVLLGGLVLVALVAAVYTVLGTGMTLSAVEMTRMADFPGQPIQPMETGSTPVWNIMQGALVFAMWWIMMIAMMVPSAAPAILLHYSLTRTINTARASRNMRAFVTGYLAIWALFSVVATGLQWALQSVGLIAPAMMTVKPAWLAGLVLILAGLYQFSPLKYACLRQCRTPARFLSENWRTGARGAWVMGLHHGTYCLGCCWALMLLLFVGGVMNLYWIAGLALLIAVEKLAPFGRITASVTGVSLILAGVLLLGSYSGV